jgi:VacB/RNase II family 3'-5' exoribonuclease
MDLRDIARRAMIERGLLPDFSEAVQTELRSITRAASSSEPSLRDMRGLLWASIDNDDSLDLDQLSVAQPLRDDAIAIFVAVADVDAVVRMGSNIDGHAQVNTTSVYTAAQIYPMLPEKLSTDLTSLGEGADRLALVVEMTVTSGGEVATSDVYRATVRNRAKLAYRSVAAWLDGSAPPPPRVQEVPGLDAQLRLQDEVAHRLRRKRFERGALSLETPEARAVFDGGTLSDLVPEERNRAKELIEDLMIAANGVTARFLDGRGLPSLRRILRSPERWAKIRDLAETFGGSLPPQPSSAALEGFLDRSRRVKPSGFADLSLSVLKLLGRGEYALELPGQHVAGHFGLALRDYAHSTAPNRRFPDLVAHRLLKAAISGRPSPYTTEQLRDLARHCTDQEDAAMKVERRVRKSAAALLLRHRIGQGFDAIVTGASPKGTYVRIDHPTAEGKVVKGSHGLDVGDRVRVELVHTDFEQGFVDFARA